MAAASRCASRCVARGPPPHVGSSGKCYLAPVMTRAPIDDDDAADGGSGASVEGVAAIADGAGGAVNLDDADPDDDGDDEAATAAATTAAAVHRLAVDAGRAGERADAAIAAMVPALSRAIVQRLIDYGRVTLNGLPVRKAGQRVGVGDAIEGHRAGAGADRARPRADPARGRVRRRRSHRRRQAGRPRRAPGPGAPARHARPTRSSTAAATWAGSAACCARASCTALDKDTSGVMVVAKTERAHAALTAAFAARAWPARAGGRRRLAASCASTSGSPRRRRPPRPARCARSTTGTRPIASGSRRASPGASRRSRTGSWSSGSPGRPAGGRAALVRFRLETGRTHQIRVHAADHGWPLLGDPLYGKPPRELRATAERLGRQALHAAVLPFDHPATGERLRFRSPLPADLAAALADLRATRSST